MAVRRRIDKACGVIMTNIVVLSLISSVMNTVILCISASKESWMFGDVSCQIHAIVCYVMLSSISWLSTLAAIERVYKCLSSGSYSMTFSEINTRLIIVGMYMTAFFLCTGPMYGWGEYSQYKGLLMLKVGLRPQEKTSVPTEYLCNKTEANTDTLNIYYIGTLISTGLQEKWNMHVRSMNALCNIGEIYFTVRIPSAKSLSLLLEESENGHTLYEIQKMIAKTKFNTTEIMKPTILIDQSDINNYKNVLLPFQSLGVCTLDFSTVNQYKKSATLYIFGTTLILPCTITALCGFVVLLQHYSGSLSNDIQYFKIIYFGGLLSFALNLPYYIINFMNGSGSFIPNHLNFMSTFLFYNSSLFLTVPYLVYRRPTCITSKARRAYSVNNGIQEDIQIDQEWTNSKVDYV